MKRTSIRYLTVPALLGAGVLAGFLAEVLVAAFFGSGPQVGVYRLATSVPALLSFAVGGAIVTAFLSELMAARQGGPARYETIYRYLFKVNIAFVWTVLAIGLLSRSWQVSILAPGLTPEQAADFKSQLILAWLLFGFVGHSFILRARLNVAGKLWVVSSVTLVRYIFFTLSFLLLTRLFPEGRYILPAALAISGFGILATHLAAIFLTSARAAFPSHEDAAAPLVNSERLHILFAVVTVAGFQFLTSLTTLMDRAVVSYEGAAMVAAFDYSVTIATAAGSVFTSFGSIVILPRAISRFHAAPGKGERDFARMIAIFLALAALSSIVLTLFDREITTLLLQRGAFSPDDSAMSARFLFWYGAGLFFLIVNSLLFLFFTAQRMFSLLYFISVVRIVIRLALLHFVLNDASVFFRVGVAFLVTEAAVGTLMFALLLGGEWQGGWRRGANARKARRQKPHRNANS